MPRTALSSFFAALVMACTTIAQLVAPPPAEPAGKPSPDKPVASTPVARPEVRAVRLSLSSGDALSSYAKTADTMRRLREAGVNTVYISAWNNGYTLFPSNALQKVVGVDRDPSLPPITAAPRPAASKPESVKPQFRDLLADAVLEAHRNGLIAIAWFEGGFMAARKDAHTPLERYKPQWLTRDAQGKTEAPDGTVWLSPLHPEVRQLLLDIVLEAAERYDLDGIQLDDHFTWPSTAFGYDEFTKKAFADEHFGQDPPADANNAAWVKWRAEKAAEFVKRVTEEVAKARPDYVLSLASELSTASPTHELALRSEWSRAGAWSEFSLRADGLSFADAEKAWGEAISAAGEAKSKFLLCIPVTTIDKPFAWEDVRKALEAARASGAAGHILDLQGTNIDAIEQPLAGYYTVSTTGRAAHPRFGSDLRPAPVKLRMNSYLGPLDSRIWRVMKPMPGTYTVSGVFQDERRVLTGLYVSTSAPKKPYEVATPKVFEDVEIIPDRRPQKLTPKKQ